VVAATARTYPKLSHLMYSVLFRLNGAGRPEILLAYWDLNSYPKLAQDPFFDCVVSLSEPGSLSDPSSNCSGGW